MASPCFYVFGGQWGRKDGFPGADGSTIQEITEGNNATTIPIYDANGNALFEGQTGMLYLNITTQNILVNNNTSIYAIKNPITYLYGGNVSDWYTLNAQYQNNNLWKASKTPYDPCPYGWHIPQDGTWADFSETTMPTYGTWIDVANGRLYNHIAWYPTAGFRSYDNGQLCHVGYDGYVWSSLSHETYARYMSFYIAGIYPSSVSSRSPGFSIRCVQE